MVCKERREKPLQGEKVSGTTAIRGGGVGRVLQHGGGPSPDVVSRYLQQSQVSKEWKDRVVSQEDIGGRSGHSWEVGGQR